MERQVITELEAAALLLAAEVEACIRIGIPMTTAAINALDNFRKKQLQKGVKLDTMIKTVQQMERPMATVTPIHRLKAVQDDNDKK
jgi:hypothetical protein